MEGRKWEELPMDCLVEVLGRVGMDSLLVDVPFVCKSWFKASLSPYCWQELDFSDIFLDPLFLRFKRQYRLQEEICETNIVKCVVDRSAGCATMVKLSFCYSTEALTYVADKCPALKKLVLHPSFPSTMLALSLVIGKLKNLESLDIEGSGFVFKDIVTKIGAHCENFMALSFVEAQAHSDDIGEEEIMAIVSCLPKIKCLALRKVYIERQNLIKILKGCVELVHLDVGDCCGFGRYDEELMKLASHIPTFEGYDSGVFDRFCSYDYDSDTNYYSD